MNKIVVGSYYVIKSGKRFVAGRIRVNNVKYTLSEDKAMKFEYFGLKDMQTALETVAGYAVDLNKRGIDAKIIGKDIFIDRKDASDELLQWEKILNDKTVEDMTKFLAEQSAGEEELTEDMIDLHKFLNHVRAIDYKTVVLMAINWKTFSEDKQVLLAIDYAGQLHASRFMIMLDFLSERLLKNEL